MKISLRAARVNADLKIEEAAKRLGICELTVRNYEKGKTCPDYDMCQLMSQVYGIPLDNLRISKHD